MTPADQYRIRAAELGAKAHEERNARLAAEYDHLAKSYIASLSKRIEIKT
jgi:hypothetical protein